MDGVRYPPPNAGVLWIPDDFEEPSVEGAIDADDAFLQELLAHLAKPLTPEEAARATP